MGLEVGELERPDPADDDDQAVAAQDAGDGIDS